MFSHTHDHLLIRILLLSIFFQCGLQNQVFSDVAEHTAPALSLDDVIHIALESNRNVISANYGIERRQWSLAATRSEFEWKFAPAISTGTNEENQSVSAAVQVDRKFTFGPAIFIKPQSVRYFDEDQQDTTENEVTASLAIPLLRGSGRVTNLNRVHMAEYDLRATQRSSQLTQINTILAAVAGTYEIVRQRETLALYETQMKHFQNHAVIAEAKKKIGLATPIDVYRAEIRMKDAQSGFHNTQETLRNAMDRLAELLATPLDPNQVLRVTAPVEILPLDISLPQAVDLALSKRVELQQARDEVAEAERHVLVARHNLHPDLDLVANYSRSQYDRYNDFKEDQVEYFTIELSGSTDWSRTVAKADYQQSQLAVRQARLNRDNTGETIKREVHQVYRALLNAHEQIRIREEQIDQAEGKLALANIKFSHGMADNFDIIESETELQRANLDLLSAKINYLVDLYRLRAAIGTLIGTETES